MPGKPAATRPKSSRSHTLSDHVVLSRLGASDHQDGGHDHADKNRPHAPVRRSAPLAHGVVPSIPEDRCTIVNNIQRAAPSDTSNVGGKPHIHDFRRIRWLTISARQAGGKLGL